MANNIKDYIQEHIKDINNFEQKEIDWVDFYKKDINDAAANKKDDFIGAIEKIKGTPKLSRKNVHDYYLEDIYTGFIATLLWGHVFHVHLQTIISTSKKDIESQLVKMINGFKKKESPSQIFQKMLNGGDYHIKGIGVSFFTKIFYFTSHIHGNNNLLILDGKMWNVYNAFLKEKGEEVKKYKVNNCQYEDYKQYCDYMRLNPSIKNIGQLEAFLFTHNNEVKSFLIQETKKQKTKPPQTAKQNNKDREWKAYEPFTRFRCSTSGMDLVKPGYCLPLKNIADEVEQYRIFVAMHIGGKFEGLYFCEIMKEWRNEKGLIDENPDAYRIFNEFPYQNSKLYNKVKTRAKQKWYNSKSGKAEAYMYRYITFDNTINKEDAIAFMKEIIDYVQNTLRN